MVDAFRQGFVFILDILGYQGLGYTSKSSLWLYHNSIHNVLIGLDEHCSNIIEI